MEHGSPHKKARRAELIGRAGTLETKTPDDGQAKSGDQELFMQVIRGIIRAQKGLCGITSPEGWPVHHSTIEFMSNDPIDEVGRFEDGTTRGAVEFVSVHSTRN